MFQKGILAISLGGASAHTRLECPQPLSLETGQKNGPCDVATDDLSVPAHGLTPGFNTITWVETLTHPGAPARFALSSDGAMDGFEECILLDHVPHDECAQSKPSSPALISAAEGPFNPQAITLWIPDIKCERCYLQLITFMTDDHGHKLPPGETCVYKGAQDAGLANSTLPICEVVYHSCAPVSINGTVPRADHTCDLSTHEQQLQWPAGLADKTPSTYLYKGDPGLHDNQGRLVSGGEPIALTDCNNWIGWAFAGMPFHCGAEYFTKKFDVLLHENRKRQADLSAPYNTHYGSCPAVQPLWVPVVDGDSMKCVDNPDIIVPPAPEQVVEEVVPTPAEEVVVDTSPVSEVSETDDSSDGSFAHATVYSTLLLFIAAVLSF